MSWVLDSKAPPKSNEPLLKTFDLICSKDLLQMSSTKQNNSKILEEDSGQNKIDTSAETRSCERINEADKHSQSTLLGFTKFVHGVDSYDNIADKNLNTSRIWVNFSKM